MGSQGLSPAMPVDQRTEERWRFLVEQALYRYRQATEDYVKLLHQQDGKPLDRALETARQSESQALAEYTQVLQVFTDLTFEGKVPEDGPGTSHPLPWDGIVHMVSVIDDDESIRDSMRSLLRSAGYSVATFCSPEDFLYSGAIFQTECAIIDWSMPGTDGLELQQRMLQFEASVPVIVVTAHDGAMVRRKALSAGAVDFLNKPFEPSNLLCAVQKALARRQAVWCGSGEFRLSEDE